jgi:hypothetical protein
MTTPNDPILDHELFAYLTNAGERAYRDMQSVAHSRQANKSPAIASSYTSLGLLIRSCIDLILPDISVGLTPRLTKRESALLAAFSRWPLGRPSAAVRMKLLRFLAAVRRIPVHNDAS